MNSIKLIVAWQNLESREWIPIGMLYYHQDGHYEFVYVKGVQRAKEAGFIPFRKMNDLRAIYASEDIFSQFAIRLLPKSRPEYEHYKRWLNLDNNSTPLDELLKNNGIRATDNIELYAIPEKQDKKYIVEFFTHGISHLIPSYKERVKQLKAGEKLYLMRDLQNKYDTNALLVRTQDPVEVVGYVPRIYTRDFSKLLKNNATLKVKQVNQDAPLQFQLLCEFSADWSDDFTPFNDNDFIRF